jgi:hypothetical protein
VRSTFPFALILSVLAASCGGDSSGPGGGNAGPPAGLTAVTGTLEGQAGQPTTLSARVVDAQNRPVPNVRVNFTIPSGGGTLSAAADTTGTDGVATVTWTVGTLLGAGRAEARVQGVLVPAVFNVNIKAGPAAAMQQQSSAIGASAAGFETADSISVKLSDQYGNAIANAPVSFSVVSGGGSVTPATATTREDGTARAAWRLGTAGSQRLRASSGTIQTEVDATASACTETTIAVGSVMTLGPADPRCVILNGTAQRYLVAVVNASNSLASTNAFRMRGAGGGTSASTDDVVASTAARMGIASASARAELEDELNRARTHDMLMRANERVMQMYGAQARAARSKVQASVVAAPPPNVGDTLNMKIPGNFSNLCSLQGAAQIRARVVYVGQRGVMLEDVAAPLAGQADSLYARIGQEFDTNMWNLLNDNFGNPLVMDAQLDNNQRFFMVFSQFVNNLAGGSVAGFVSSTDFVQPTGCPTSNLGEVFYARVPVTSGTGSSATPEGAISNWYRTTRTVMIHEVKHIVSFAERFARGWAQTQAFNDNDRWLEESSAMIAEELWGRIALGYAPKTNINYRNSIHCEVRASPQFEGDCPKPYKPTNIVDHFANLYDYMVATEGRSPMGSTSSDDFSFYGSGWAFLRWLIDTHITSESTFLKSMTGETTLPGVQNVEAKSGRSWVELVNDWAVAMLMDDYPGFTPANAKYSFPSWNSRDIFAGLNRDFGTTFFPRAVPIAPRAAAFGKFSIDVGAVRGGGFAVFEMAGTQSQRQMIEFNGLSGTSFPSDMRVNIIRVQ